MKSRCGWLLWLGAGGAAILAAVALIPLTVSSGTPSWERYGILFGYLLLGAGFAGYLRFGARQGLVLGPVMAAFGVVAFAFSFVSIPPAESARLFLAVIPVVFWITTGFVGWFMVERAFSGPAAAWHAVAAFGVVVKAATEVFYRYAWSSLSLHDAAPSRSVEWVRGIGFCIAYATLAAAFVAAAAAGRSGGRVPARDDGSAG